MRLDTMSVYVGPLFNMMPPYSVGWIGTGIMGASMCSHLIVGCSWHKCVGDELAQSLTSVVGYQRIMATKSRSIIERFRNATSYEKTGQESQVHQLK